MRRRFLVVRIDPTVGRVVIGRTRTHWGGYRLVARDRNAHREDPGFRWLAWGVYRHV